MLKCTTAFTKIIMAMKEYVISVVYFNFSSYISLLTQSFYKIIFYILSWNSPDRHHQNALINDAQLIFKLISFSKQFSMLVALYTNMSGEHS